MANSRHKGTSNQGTSQPLSGTPPSTSNSSNSWATVVKRHRGKQRHVPFTPRIVHPSATISSSFQALSGDSQPFSVELVHPFIHGLERDSVLIDITNVNDLGLLEDRLKQFNINASQPDRSNDFIGYPETVRTYLDHRFLETMWVPHSEGRQTILNEGVFLADGTFLKGFSSYPVNAKIVYVKLKNLPYLPGRMVMKDMQKIMSCYGELLDLGITQINHYFFMMITVVYPTTQQQHHTRDWYDIRIIATIS